MHQKSHQLRLAHWNANGLQNKTIELANYMQEKKINIMMISETHLKPSKHLSIPNYDTIREDGQIHRGGGTAILIKGTIKYQLLPKIEDEKLEATGIMVNTAKEKFNFYCIYIPPGDNLPSEALLKMLEQQILQ